MSVSYSSSLANEKFVDEEFDSNSSGDFFVPSAPLVFGRDSLSFASSLTCRSNLYRSHKTTWLDRSFRETFLDLLTRVGSTVSGRTSWIGFLNISGWRSWTAILFVFLSVSDVMFERMRNEKEISSVSNSSSDIHMDLMINLNICVCVCR